MANGHNNSRLLHTIDIMKSILKPNYSLNNDIRPIDRLDQNI